jgi:hypothetical protein
VEVTGSRVCLAGWWTAGRGEDTREKAWWEREGLDWKKVTGRE